MLGYVAGSKEVLLTITDPYTISKVQGFEVMDDFFSYPGDPPGGPSSGVLFAKEAGRAIILGRNEIRHVWLDLATLVDEGSSRISFGDDPSYPDSLSNFGFLTDDYFVVSRVLDAVLEIHLLNSDVDGLYFDFSVDHGFTNVAATKVTCFDDTDSGLTNVFTCSHEPDSSALSLLTSSPTMDMSRVSKTRTGCSASPLTPLIPTTPLSWLWTPPTKSASTRSTLQQQR